MATKLKAKEEEKEVLYTPEQVQNLLAKQVKIIEEAYKGREPERITNIEVSDKGYEIDKSGIIFDKDMFIQKWHDMEEKAILRIIGICAFLLLLLMIVS